MRNTIGNAVGEGILRRMDELLSNQRENEAILDAMAANPERMARIRVAVAKAMAEKKKKANEGRQWDKTVFSVSLVSGSGELKRKQYV